jgi:hypothetical protein
MAAATFHSHMPSTATIKDVELVSVGTWAASTGVTKVTRPDLDSMLAAHADGLVDHAPVKLGHASSLNDELGDGAPAYGWVVPTRIGTNKAGLETLYGDLVGMPAQLAAVAPTAYRRRSVEIAWGVTTPAGDKYAAALVGVALLGASAPAVKGLADVMALYTGDPQVDRVTAVELVDGLEGNPVAVAMLAAARTAGAPVEQLDAMADAAGASDTADVPPPTADADNHDQHTTTPATADGRTTMPKLTDEQLRAALNLEADADVDTALAGILAERGTDPATAGTDPQVTPEGEPATDPATPADPAPQSTPQGDPVEDPAGDPVHSEPELAGASALSSADVAEFTRLAAESRDRRRTDAINSALSSGRISPAEVPHFREKLEKGGEVEASTITLLGQLSPRFAVTEFGDDRAQETQLGESAVAALDAFEAETFPELARVRTPQQ